MSGIAAAHLALLLYGCCNVTAAEVDVSKLPPPVERQVDFTSDIQPILQQNCLKCHGPERPRSRFRLDDRDAALKGGNNDPDDIVPGDSARSRLIHYVARLVPDMEMPPRDEGEPLAAEQISLLRAWIDQGAQWRWESAEPQNTLELSPTLGFISVHGDEAKFREHSWMRDGWGGGISSFEGVQQLSPESKLTLKGHALLDDYRIELLRERRDVGFIRFAWQQYRRYYDDSGGLDPATSSTTDLGRDLHLDIGKAGVDFGLTLPHWPQMTLGYELQYRDGDKSTTQWGIIPGMTNNVLPASKEISEYTHIIKFDLTHEIAGVSIEDNFRGEFYSLKTRRESDGSLFDIPAQTLATEGATHFQGMNTFRLERQFADWLFAAGGYLYTKLDGDASVNLDTASWSTVPSVLTRVDLERESHVFSANGMLGPWEGLSLSAAVQNEWSRQTGFGDANADLYLPVFIEPGPVNFSSDTDRLTTEENVALRYTRLPFTVLFAEARLRQECIGQHESEDAPVDQFLRDTDAVSDLMNLRFGFSTSPWRSVSLSAHYRHEDRDTDYDHNTDTSLFGGDGYSAFITSREILTEEIETKLAFRPVSWLKTTLGYKLMTTDYSTMTDPVASFSLPASSYTSDYDAHIYSLGMTWTPWRRLYFSSTFSWKDARTATFTRPDLSVSPYQGDVYSVLASSTWAATESTDLVMSYAFSLADFSQSNNEGNVPLGIEYQQHGAQIGLRRKFKSGVTTSLRYGLYLYDEASTGGENDYVAHAAFVSLSYRFP